MSKSGNASAKINLNLHVVGQGSDGYHQLQSLVVFTKFGDQLTLEKAPKDRLIIKGPFAKSLDARADNLVTKALNLFRQTWPEAAPNPLEITLTKNLPVASGIGGGSSDAATMLKLLQAQSQNPIPDAALLPLAIQLGADVPVCLNQQPTLMQGMGEHLTPLKNLPKLFMVLANPLKSVSTKEVFAALTKKQNPKLPPMPKSFATTDTLIGWLKTTRNHLSTPASQLVPQITTLTQFLAHQPKCQLARMSGSGATVFGLFEMEGAADKAAKNLAGKWPEYWCVSTGVL